MRSFLASLRTLVLPFGVTSGPRIVLDGVTGKITAYAANGSRIEINPNNSSPVIQFFSRDGTNDAFINTVVNAATTQADLGINSGKFTPGDGVQRRGRLFFNDSADIVTFSVIKESSAADMGGNVLLTAELGEFGYHDTAAGTKNKITFNATQAFASVPIHAEVAGVAETWHSVSAGPGYQNSWADRGAGFPPLSYRKIVSPPNCIHIAGQASGGTIPTSVVFTLPAGYRPANEIVVNNSTGVIAVATNGNVSIIGAGSAFVQFSAVIPLDL